MKSGRKSLKIFQKAAEGEPLEGEGSAQPKKRVSVLSLGGVRKREIQKPGGT